MKLPVFLCLLVASIGAHAQIDLSALREAARSRDIPALSRMADNAQNDPLEMYPRYYLLSTQLNTVAQEDVDAFFARFDGTPLAERLRQDWLKELGRRQDWAHYVVEFPKLDSPSLDLQCLNAQARIAATGSADLSKLRGFWFADKGQPESCGPIFESLFSAGQLTQEDAWLRIRMALSAGRNDFATQLAPRVGFPSELTGRVLGQANSQPQKALGKLDYSHRAGREVALFAVQRIARTDPDAAAQALDSLKEKLPEADRRYGWQQIAEIAAKKQYPEASGWFSRGGLDGLDADGRAWSVRAALRVGDMTAVLDRIAAMPADQAAENAWRYWYAQALKRANRAQEAAPILLKLSDGDDFYALLAREEAGPALEATPSPYLPTDTEIKTVGAKPGVVRALALFGQNWRVEGNREWNWAMRDLSPQELVAASTLAARNKIYDRSIYSAERAKPLSGLVMRFPTPYREQIEREARAQNLDPAWVYGLIRQESRFVADIRSGAGASGLMQLMPSTAQWVGKKNGQKKLDISSLTDPDTNVAYGAFYLRYILDRLGGQAILATAGYNAGPGRAKAWQDDTRQLDPIVYIETIPFEETRDYVKKVMANAQLYGASFGESESFHTRLAPIPGKNVDAATIDAP
ncbi:transglycosylase SLT domain-containing protein [Silvimonas sp.]|uniref:lytic transglycosylase domain-containing protein n=1 Tax=Silvimonas sp. TaxID=2650811 RepID=UPI002845A51A|nr:transglycosylase SLT domain-containing protein [Silvimonas sp.]MDR3425915.1 transglycosylase SLT domain-containing protein [Silvimonas sp.]